jgi:hypothetical protein
LSGLEDIRRAWHFPTTQKEGTQLPQNHKTNDPVRYFNAFLDVRRGYTKLPTESESQIEEVKGLIRRGEFEAGFLLLNAVQQTVQHLCRTALTYAEQNLRMKLEKAVASRDEAERLLAFALRDGDLEAAAAARTCVDGNNRWMAHSIEYLGQ